MYLFIYEDGSLQQNSEIQPGWLEAIEDGIGDIVRFQDGKFEQATILEPVVAQPLELGAWVKV